MVWQFLSRGRYNQVYVDFHLGLVLKKSIDPSTPYDHPLRSVRLWNLINDDLAQPARLYSEGWVCPYIKGRQASDREIMQSLIDIYHRCGRIVLDACSRKNMVYSYEYKKIICLDVGMVVLLEEEEEHSSSYSPISHEIWKKLKPGYIRYFNRNEEKYPLTISTIKALMLLKHYHPQQSASFLSQSNSLLFEIARIFNNGPLTDLQLFYLNQLIPKRFSDIKQQIRQNIQNLLSKYGAFNSYGEFRTSCSSRFFGPRSRIQILENLLQQMEESENYHELYDLIHTRLHHPKYTSGCCCKNPFITLKYQIFVLLEHEMSFNLDSIPTRSMKF
jgi:hypothetical protein